MVGTLSDLIVYPLKSAGGISLTEAKMDRWGLEHDRRWLVIDPEGVFLTQRQIPRMALIAPQLQESALVLNAPGIEPLELPLTEAEPPTQMVRVWNDTALAVPLGWEAADWVSTFLGTPCSLVRFSDAAPRTVDPTYSEADDQVGFADGFPFLLTTEASLADLNTRLTEPLPMNRFRPNLVVRDTLPYAEDNWYKLKIRRVWFSCCQAVCTVQHHNG